MHPTAFRIYCAKLEQGVSRKASAMTYLTGAHHFHIDKAIQSFAKDLVRAELKANGPFNAFPAAARLPSKRVILGDSNLSTVFGVTEIDGYNHVHYISAEDVFQIGMFKPGTDLVQVMRPPKPLEDNEKFFGRMAFALSELAHIISLVNSPRIVLCQAANGLDFTRQYKKQVTATTGQPALAFTRVSWDLRKPVKAKRDDYDENGKPKPLHWARAHWRICEETNPNAYWVKNYATGISDWRQWIPECWKGHPAYGFKPQVHHAHMGRFEPAYPGAADDIAAIPAAKYLAMTEIQKSAEAAWRKQKQAA